VREWTREELAEEAVLSIIRNPEASWIVVLAPFTRKTRETGRVPVLVEFSGDESLSYTGWLLNGSPAGEAALGSERVGHFLRQHMSPGATVRGVGIGTVMYLCGSIQASLEDGGDPKDTCTASPTKDTFCEDIGGGKSAAAYDWWDKAVEKEVAFVEEIECWGEVRTALKLSFTPDEDHLIELLEESLLDEPEWWEEALLGKKVPAKGLWTPSRLGGDFEVDSLEVKIENVKESHWVTFRVKGHWTVVHDEDWVAEGVDFQGDFEEGEVDVENVEPSLIPFTGVVDGLIALDLDSDGAIESAAVDEMTRGSIEVEIAEAVEVAAVVNLRGVLTSEAVQLCGARVLEESDSILAASEDLDLEVAPAEVYAQMSLTNVQTQVLEEVIRAGLDDQAEAEAAMDALESSVFTQKDGLKLRRLRSDLYAPRQGTLRLDNPRGVMDEEEAERLYEEALDFGEVTEAGDGNDG